MEETPYLEQAVDEVRAELARADTKASMLLAASGAVAALLASGGLLATEGPAGWVVRAGLAILAAAVAVLLATVRPARLAKAPFTRAATDPDWRPETPQERMANLATVATAKFRRIRLAVDLLASAGVVLAIGVTWAGVS